MRKRILGFTVALIYMVLLSPSIYAFNASISEITNNVVIEGALNSGDASVPLTILLIKNAASPTPGDVGHVAQISTNNDGSYFYKFRFNHDVKDYVLSVKNGADDVTNSVIRAVAQGNSEVIECSGKLENGVYHLEYNPKNTYGNRQKYDLNIAFYDENDRLIGCKSYSDLMIGFDGSGDKNRTVFDEAAPENTKYVKSFVWRTTVQMVPVATMTDSVNVDFGYKLETLFKSGYKPLTGDNNFERFQNAVNELPDEVNVISPIRINEENTLYVSPEGSDSNDGSINSPFKTIQYAVDCAGQLSGNVSIYLRQGVYKTDKAVTVSNENKPKNEQAIFIGAYQGEDVTVGGVDNISGSSLTKVSASNTDADTINHIDAKAKNNIYYVSYDIGISDNLSFETGTDKNIPVAYYNGQKISIASYPNVGSDYINTVIDSGVGDDSSGNAIFTPKDNSVFSWKSTNDLGISGLFAVPWSTSVGVAEVDTLNNTIASDSLSANGYPVMTYLRYEEAGPSHFVYFNALDNIDVPGEWIFDNDSRRIYIYPFNCDTVSSDNILLKTLNIDSIFDINGVKNIVIDGLNLFGAKSGIVCRNSENIVVQKCNIKGIAGTGMCSLNCRKSGIINSEITDTSWGVNLSGNDMVDMMPDANFCQNNIFNKCNQAVLLDKYSTGSIVSHNLFENLQGRAVFNNFSSENIIEYNEMVTCGLKGREGGCMYSCGDLLCVNNHVRNNYIHDMVAPEVEAYSTGINTSDDLMDGTYTYGNIMSNVRGVGIGMHSGDDHIVYNNIVIDNEGSAASNSPHYGMKNWDASLGNIQLNNATEKKYYKSGYLNDKWNRRHPEFKEKADFILGVAELWNQGGEDNLNSDDMLFLRADTGCYYINNIGVGGCNIPQPSDYQYGSTYGTDVHGAFGKCYTAYSADNMGSIYGMTYSERYGIPELTELSSVPKYKGRDYNVVSGNTKVDSINLNEYATYNKAGLTEDLGDMDSASININWYKRDNDGLLMSWHSDGNGINYYKVIIASDANFNNILVSQNTHACSLESDSSYSGCYVKVQGIGMTRDNEGLIAESDPVYILYK